MAINYFQIMWPSSETLLAENNKSRGERMMVPCPISSDHWDVDRRISQLYLELKHNHRDEQIIWGAGCAVHEKTLEEFEREGFTGYRTRPALVRFRDGATSSEYHEFITTGWAGMASPDSGVRLIRSCPGCHHKEYSAITNYDKIIDWNQWTGDDFFIVWPMGWPTLCTERVAQWLTARKVKSIRLGQGFELRRKYSIISKLGFFTGRLSDYLPEDLATKYGRPLGLE